MLPSAYVILLQKCAVIYPWPLPVTCSFFTSEQNFLKTLLSLDRPTPALLTFFSFYFNPVIFSQLDWHDLKLRMLPPPQHIAKSRGHIGPILLCISREFDTAYLLLEINASLSCCNAMLFWVSSSLTGCLLLNSFPHTHISLLGLCVLEHLRTLSRSSCHL